MPKWNVTIAQVVVVEADSEWRAAGVAARQYDSEVLSVESAEPDASLTRPTATPGKTARKPKKNTMLANAAKARWAPGGDLRIAHDKKKAAAKKAAAKKK